MTVRHSLLAILTTGDAYGYQLRQEFNRRTDSVWPLNVGQVYTTLDRLERDGLVEQRGTDAEGHVVYAITEAGREECEHWLATPTVVDDRSETAIKLALAMTLPGANPAALIESQREAALTRSAGQGVIGLWHREQTEAELRWLDAVADLEARPAGLETAPRRGRPARTPR